jgi:hypothetical protein
MRTARLARFAALLFLLPPFLKTLLMATFARLRLLHVALLTYGRLSIPEPPGRKRLLTDVHDVAPPWSNLSQIHLDVVPSAWDTALVQHHKYRSFLQRALWHKHAAFTRCVLDSCALYQDYAVLVEVAKRDEVKVASLRAAFGPVAKQELSAGPWRHELPATFKRLWTTLLRDDGAKASLLLDIWNAPGHAGERIAAAFAVYAMFVLDFLRVRAKLNPEVLADGYALAMNAAFSAAELKGAPDAWRAQLAALRMGKSLKPQMRR